MEATASGADPESIAQLRHHHRRSGAKRILVEIVDSRQDPGSHSNSNALRSLDFGFEMCSCLGHWLLFNLLLQDRSPRLVGIESLHGPGELGGLWTKILLVDDSVVTDHESLHSRDPVLGGKSDEGKAADHHALNHEVQLAERRCRSLPFENSEVVAVKRLRS